METWYSILNYIYEFKGSKWQTSICLEEPRVQYRVDVCEENVWSFPLHRIEKWEKSVAINDQGLIACQWHCYKLLKSTTLTSWSILQQLASARSRLFSNIRIVTCDLLVQAAPTWTCLLGHNLWTQNVKTCGIGTIHGLRLFYQFERVLQYPKCLSYWPHLSLPIKLVHKALQCTLFSRCLMKETPAARGVTCHHRRHHCPEGYNEMSQGITRSWSLGLLALVRSQLGSQPSLFSFS